MGVLVARTWNSAAHPRDKFGRFTKSRTVKATAKDKNSARQVWETFTPARISEAERSDYLRRVAGDRTPSLGDLPQVNTALRAGDESAPGVTAVDQQMVDLPDDVVLSRAVPLSAFGRVDPTDLTGMKVRDAGFSAAQIGRAPAADGQVRMLIAAPAGTRAAVDPATGEVVLDRDTEMVVAGVTDTGSGYDMYLTVLPKKAAPNTPAGQANGDDAGRAELMKLRAPELRARMRERGLTPGKLRKSQMVDRLVADETGDEPEVERDPEPTPTPGRTEAPATDDTNPPNTGNPAGPAGESTSGQDALAAAPIGLHRDDADLTREQQTSLAEYQDGYRPGYKGINAALRDGNPDAATQAWVDGIDSAMTASPLTADVTTWRGIRDARTMFGNRVDGDLTGMEWREDAYVSTTADEAATAPFSQTSAASPLRMRIVTPAGTSAVDLSDPDDPSEAELLLDRGHTFKVAADRGVIDGVRHLDVQVQPKTTPTPDTGEQPGSGSVVDGSPSTTPVAPNTWGGIAGPDDIHYHDDGEIGSAVKAMGADRLMDVDGQPLENVLGRIATDTVFGRTTSQEQVDALKRLRDRLPEGSQARRGVDDIINRLDAPLTPPPAVPDGVPTPLRDLTTALHGIPLIRREPAPEMASLEQLLADYAAGRLGGKRLIAAIRALRNRRHESVEGKAEVDRTVDAAVAALEALAKANGPRSLYARETTNA